MQNKIFLIGARASGKTSLGQALAQKLQWQFVDTDALLQDALACSVADFVALHGWQAFREAESQVLHKTTQTLYENSVIATGGGMVLREDNRLFMRKNGHVVFLQVPVCTLVRRLSLAPKHAQRPSLTGQGLTQEVESVLCERLPLYVSTAHMTVDADQDIDRLVEKVCAFQALLT